MKNLIFAVLLLFCGATVCAQTTTKEQRKAFIQDRKNCQKMAAAAVGKKITKMAAQEAKRQKKDGWQPIPGGLPLDAQLTNYYTKIYEQVGNFPKYVSGTGITTGGNISAARKQAVTLAIVDVATNLGAEVTDLTETAIDNKSINSDDAESITKSTAKSQVIVEQKLKSLKPAVEMYRTLPNGKKEISIQLLYDGMEARATILSELEKSDKTLAEKFENITK